jgi:hypothetical protein
MMNTRPFSPPSQNADKILSNTKADLARIKVDLALIRYKILLMRGERWLLTSKEKKNEEPRPAN